MRIAIYAFDDITLFHLSVPQMVFDEVRRLGLADWTTVVFSDHPGSVRSAEGLTIGGVAGPEAAADADVVVVPSWHDDGRPSTPALQRVLADASARRAPIAGLCLGTFPLAEAGLLAGRSAVTHWREFGLLASLHPDIALDEGVLYIDHGDILTSAGTASGLDACLHVVRTRLGADAANQVARNLVIAPHREGGQAQYIERPIAHDRSDDAIATVLDWALAHLAEPLTIETLAARAHQSRRTFIRAFRAGTGTTPAAWVRARRLDEARRLLETGTLPIEHIARDCGFGSAVTFRQLFLAEFGTTPSRYRARFTTA
jgi:transcriptional regulator GlxA family with amidase domain